MVIPWALSATSVAYNVPGAGGRIRLDGPTIANIYLGKITNWNDAAIAKLNPKLTLPSMKITPVYRSDGSGTTYKFTEYLSTVSSEFKSKVGTNTSVDFPTGIGARGSSGVTGVVKNTPGALTYVDAAYSMANKLSSRWSRTGPGSSRRPGSAGSSGGLAAAEEGHELGAAEDRGSAQGRGQARLPDLTFTYVILPTGAKKAADLRKFVYWAVTQGQKFGPPLLFVPLPAP